MRKILKIKSRIAFPIFNNVSHTTTNEPSMYMTSPPTCHRILTLFFNFVDRIFRSGWIVIDVKFFLNAEEGKSFILKDAIVFSCIKVTTV